MKETQQKISHITFPTKMIALLSKKKQQSSMRIG